MAGLGEQLELGQGDRGGVGASVVDVDDPVALAPEHEGGDLQGPETPDEGGVGHGGARVDGDRGPVARGDRLGRRGQGRGVDAERLRVVEGEPEDLIHGQGEEVGHRMAGHLDPDRVDQDDAADARRLQQRDLGGDPAADRVADDGDVGQRQLVQERAVEHGQAGHGGQCLGALGAAEAGVGRDQYAHAVSGGELLGEPRHRLRAGSAVQQQERLSVTESGHGHLDRVDSVEADGVVSGGCHGLLLDGGGCWVG